MCHRSTRPEVCNFIKKETQKQVLSCEWFYKICKTTFLTEHLLATASGVVFNNRFPFNNFGFMISKANNLYILEKINSVAKLVNALIMLIKFIPEATKISSFVSVLFFSLAKKYNFSVSIRCCVHISIIGLNSINWIESYRLKSFRKAQRFSCFPI